VQDVGPETGPEDGCGHQDPAFGGRQGVEPCRDHPLERVGNVAAAPTGLLDRRRSSSSRDALEQHPGDLDRIQRYATGTMQDRIDQAGFEIRGAVGEEDAHRLIGEPIQRDCREPPEP